jgi:hypothetical protein
MNNGTQDNKGRPRQGWGSRTTNDGEGEKTTINSKEENAMMMTTNKGEGMMMMTTTMTATMSAPTTAAVS